MESPPLERKRRRWLMSDELVRDKEGGMAGTSCLTSPNDAAPEAEWTLDFSVMGETVHGDLEADPELRDLKARKFVDSVTHALRLKQQGVCKVFRVCDAGIAKRFTSEIDEWIQFVMRSRVEVLVLDSLADFYNLYTFPELTKLTWYNNIDGGFEHLKTLELHFVDLTQDTLDELLCNCPNLERLLMHATMSVEKLSVIGNLDYDRPIALKFLSMRCNKGLKAIEICNAPYLTSLFYDGLPIDVVIIKDVPLLSEVSLSYFVRTNDCIRLPFSQLSACISQLHTLMMDIHVMEFEVYKENHAIPVLPNLKRFELVVCADSCSGTNRLLTSFLNAFPHLCCLVLKLQFMNPFSTDPGTSYFPMQWYEKKDATSPHHYLKVLEIVGYRHRLNAVELVKHVIETATALERIVINPVRWNYHVSGTDKWVHDYNMEEDARNGAMHILKKEVPSTIDFVVL